MENVDELLPNAKIESNIPVGVGLGSSASLSCALARSFPQSNAFELAKRFDDHFHQGSSGIDVFTILYGGLCSLSPERGFERLPDLFLDYLNEFSFSIINTGVERSVASIKSKLLPEQIKEYAQQIRPVSESFFNHLQSNVLTLPVLISLFNEANRYLICLGVSTPLLNDLFDRIIRSGLLIGAKITGGGGGGCVLLVHDRSLPKASLDSFVPAGGILYFNIKFKR